VLLQSLAKTYGEIQMSEKNKAILLEANAAIADIALQVGFSSQSHLTQQFKRLTGMTPKQVR
jgi:AraC family transcriptional regulator